MAHAVNSLVTSLRKAPQGWVRLYLCRHGETDWNLQSRIQGLTDRPLNARGLQQASALGEFLSGVPLSVVGSSTLQRARQTADAIAAAQSVEPLYKKPRRLESFEAVLWERFKKFADVKLKEVGLVSNEEEQQREVKRVEIQDLCEMNFGELEGKTVTEVKLLMREVRGAWKEGHVDRPWPGDGGENVVDVEERALRGLAILGLLPPPESRDLSCGNAGPFRGEETWQDVAPPGGQFERLKYHHMAFVAHGRLNQILLTSLLKRSLQHHEEVVQSNCCVNIVDVDPLSGQTAAVALNLTQHLETLPPPT